MSCEIYDNLRGFSLLKTDKSLCAYDRQCPKTCESCQVGKIIKRVEDLAILQYQTPEDLEHDMIVAELEAKKEYEKELRNIKEEGQSNALISISRVN